MTTHTLHSPNAIPPRTSSNSIFASPPHPVLCSFAEDDWISSSTRLSLSALSPSPPLSSSRQTTQAALPMTPPPPDPLNKISSELIYGKGSGWSQEKETILLGPYKYLYGNPGKDLRTKMIAAFNEWLHVPEKSLETITKVVGMLHTASLLVDDVEDSSELRRGVPVANKIFGTAQTINSANYVYFLALEELSRLQHPDVISIFIEELLNLHRGQGMDLYWRDTLTCPTENDYLEMVGNKTGGLFRLAVKLMQAESTRDLNCVPLVNAIGLLFQILDDHLNLKSERLSAQKGFAEDLTEGKFSFPIIHAVRADPDNHVIVNVLKQKTPDPKVKMYAVAYMDSTRSFEYSANRIADLRAKALQLVQEVRLAAGDVDGPKGAACMEAILEEMEVK